MPTDALLKSLHPLEVKVLLAYGQGEPFSAARLERDLAFKPGQSNQALSWLAGKGLAEEVSRQRRLTYTLTELGQVFKAHGTLEERLAVLLKQEGPLTLPEIASRLAVEAKEIGSAFGAMSKAGWAAMNEAKKAVLAARAELRESGLATIRALFSLFDNREEVSEEELSPAPAELIAPS